MNKKACKSTDIASAGVIIGGLSSDVGKSPSALSCARSAKYASISSLSVGFAGSVCRCSPGLLLPIGSPNGVAPGNNRKWPFPLPPPTPSRAKFGSPIGRGLCSAPLTYPHLTIL